MGGNVFTGKTRRYDKDEYFAIEAEVLSILSGAFTEEALEAPRADWIQPLKAYRSKESFGDMDIVVNSAYIGPDYVRDVIQVFNLKDDEYNKNGNVFSFVYKEFQIDLIVTKPSEFKTSLDYGHWNDCGNLVGRISHKLGLKFGHDGTTLIIKENDQVMGEIVVTRNTCDLFDLLGLDYEQWKNGFDTLEDMFEWVSSSTYFNPDIYLLDNRNNHSRARDAKRKTYHAFLEWCASRAFDDAYKYDSTVAKGGYNIREPFFSELIVPAFPHVLIEYNEIVAKHVEHAKFKRYFNGDSFSKVTGLTGKELGAFMSWAKEQCEKKDLSRLYREHEEHTCNLTTASLYFHYQNNFNFGEMPWEFAVNYVRN